MKQYINKKESEELVFLTMLLNKADDIVKDDETRKVPLFTKQERGWIKRACTMITKQAMVPAVGNLTDEAKNKYVAACKGTTIVCQPKESMAEYKRRIARERKEEDCIVNQEALYSLAEMALLGCNPCQHKTDDERTECVVRKVLLELMIPVYDPTAEICPYLISKEE